MSDNKLIIAAAGSGKTTYLVNEAKNITDENVLITTYTESNEAEIRNKFNGCIPKNIKIQTWFSFLLQHGVRPYQSIMNDELHNKKIGFFLTGEKSAKKYDKNGNPIYIKNPMTGIKQPVYWGEKENLLKYYFTKDIKIYSDKISKFIFECNNQTKGEVINRISRIYKYIYIDEIQDLAGWDLEIIKLLIDSESNILMVGDPRQVTYLTQHSGKYEKYIDGKIKEFIEQEFSKKGNLCFVDEITLQKSHRNNKLICEFSSSLYPQYPASIPCECEKCRKNKEIHEGIFLIRENDVDEYLQQYKPIQLRWSISKRVNPNFDVYNFGYSKGLSFDHVLIYPTDPMTKWIFNNNFNLTNEARAKFYVAITRAKHSVGIVYDYSDKKVVKGINKWKFK